MRMNVMQQINYREKMYKRHLGMINPETGDLYEPSAAMRAASEMLRHKMKPYLAIADKAPGKEDGYQPRADSVYRHD